ncbi:tandem-95 repeat protein, partial [Labilibacter sediminis]
TIALDDYIDDVETLDANMIWSIDETPVNISVVITDRVATITALDENWNGSETITFRAQDEGGLEVTDQATFTVTAENDLPVISDIPNQTVAEGGSFATISLDDYIDDVETLDANMIWSIDETPVNISVVITDRVATIAPLDENWNGSETITFRARDEGGLEVTDQATFTVTAVNDLPVISDIPNQTIAEGGSFATIALDDYIDDVETLDANMVWSIDETPVNISVVITDRVATITPLDENWNGSETITFRARDEGGLEVTDQATFTVTAENDLPVISDIPNQSIAEGGSFTTIALDDYIDDVETADAAMIWSIDETPVNISVVITDRVATITPLDENWNGSETITFRARDEGGLEVTDQATFTMTAVNDLPVISDIPNQTVAEGGSFATIALDDYIDDVETLDANIIWSIDETPVNISVVITDRVATITPLDENWNGSETITFRAQDEGGLEVTDQATFTVTPENDLPVISDIPNQTIAEGGSFATIALDDYIDDVETLDANIIWSVDETPVNISVVITDRVATITPLDENWNGSETITFRARDEGGLEVTNQATFTVTAVNDLPVISDIPNQTIAEGGSFATIALDDYIDDVETLDANMVWSIDETPVNISVVITDRVATITPLDENWNGSETITFRARDEGGLEVTDQATFTVTAENDLPVISDIPNQSIAEGGSFTTIALDDYIDDVETADAAMIWSIDETPVNISVVITDRVATITPLDENWNGSETITFMARDEGGLEVTDQATFTVTAVNDLPVISDIPNQSIAEGGSFTTITLDDYIDDVETLDANMIWSIDETPVNISVVITDRVATITPQDENWNGSETITFRARDEGGLEVTDQATFTVTEINDAPVITGQRLLSTDEETELTIVITDLTVFDIDNSFPDDHILIVQDGTNYAHVGNTIIPNVDINGNISVNVLVSDGQLENSGSEVYALLVSVIPVNDNPVITGQELLSTDEETPLTIAISDLVVTDVDNTFPEDHSLIIQGGVGYTYIGNTITPILNLYGEISVNAIVSDGQSVNASSEVFQLKVIVNPVNDAPVITGQNAVSVAEESLRTITVNDLVVTDVDDTYPTGFTISVSTGSNYSVSGNSITPNENIVGDIVVPVTVLDPHGAESNVWNLIVSVVNDNDPPVVSDIPNQIIDEGGAFSTIDLNLFVSDADHSDDQITWTTFGQIELVVVIDNESKEAQVSTPNENWFGSEIISFIASDGTLSDEDQAVFTVNAINDAPVISSQNPVSTNEDEALTIPLGALIVEDVDNTYPDEHTLSVLSGENYTFNNQTITPVRDFNGVLTVPVTVSDLGSVNALSNTYNLSVTVNPVNDSPVITGQSSLSTDEETELTISIASITATDVDNNFPDEHSLVIQDGVGYTHVGNNITPNADVIGSITVNAIISDGEPENDESLPYGLTVLVNSINDAPVITGQNSLSTDEETALEITVDDIIFTDVDNNITAGSHSVIVTDGVGYTYSGNIITPNVDVTIPITVNVVVSDGESENNLSAPFGLSVSINPVNDSPVITGQNLLSTNEETAIELTINDIIFTDVDNTITPSSHTLIVQDGVNYSHSGNIVTPALNITDDITVNVVVSDGELENAESDVFPVTLSINPVNDAPVITGQYPVSVAEETLRTIALTDLIVTDVDNSYPTGFTLTVSAGSNYSVVNSSITPNENVVGEIIVPVSVRDPNGASSNQWNLVVMVVNDNDPPVVIDIPNQTIDEGGSFDSIDLNIYVSDADHSDEEITWTVMGVSELEVTINPVTRLAAVEVPDINWFGTDSIRFIANDGTLTDEDEVVFTVNPVNDAPIITNQLPISTDEDVPVVISLSSLVVTDIDNDYPSEHSLSIQDGTNYTVGEQTITPDENFNGLLTVPVIVNDIASQNSSSNIYNLSVTVNAINDAPIITGLSEPPLNTEEDVALVINVSDFIITDVDNTLEDYTLILQSGENYTVENSSIVPALNYFGTLSVEASVSDGESINNESNRFRFEVLVTSVNDAPQAEDFSITTAENQQVVIDINSHVTDVDGNLDISTLHILSDVSHGATSVDAENGEVTYIPNSSFSGSDEFEYKVCDNEFCDSAVVTITVSNEAPTANEDVVALDEDAVSIFNVLTNDSDPQNNIDSRTLKIISEPVNGSAVVLTDGDIRYTPNQDFYGKDQIRYEVCDQDGYCASAIVFYTINSVNDQPVINSQQLISILEDESETITLNHLSVTDVDNNYPNDFVLTVLEGDNYSITGNTVSPDPHFNGDLLVNIIVDDQGAENNVSEVFIFTIEVVSVNDKPVISDQSILTTDEDVSLVVDITDLTIIDPDNIYPDDFILVVLPGLNYSVSETTIIPDPNFYGGLNVPIYVSDQSDENDRSKIYNLEIEVLAINDAPVTTNINQSTPENVAIEIEMASMVSDVDGNIDLNTFDNISSPEFGTLTTDFENYTITYLPNDGFTGEDSFNFRFYDTDGAESNISSVTINVTNEAPNAMDDEIVLNEDESVVYNIITNDTDPQNNIDLTTLIIVSNPLNGEATIDTSNGELNYTPFANYNGTDRLIYRISDELGYSDQANVEITITPVNDIPVAVADEAEVLEDESIAINVLANDSDIDSDIEAFAVSISSQPLNGSVSIDENTKECIYTPDANFNGNDSFEYELCDGGGGCDSAMVEITVIPQNDTPNAMDDSAQTEQSMSVNIAVVENDSDIDGNLDVTSVSIVSGPQNGNVIVESLTGEITYTSDEDFSGNDSFIYSICDTNGACDNATVTITVTELIENLAPDCINDTIYLTDGESIDFNVLTNDVDVNGDEITVLFDADHNLIGDLTEVANGQFNYASVFGDFCIEEEFTYQGCDEFGSCGHAKVVFVIGVSDADSDNIADFIEGKETNTDGDEWPDYLDDDSDNDGIRDIDEGGIQEVCLQDLLDTDDDGIPDYRDLDSDEDGLSDDEDGSDDCDNDGIPNYRDVFDDCGERIDAPDTFSPNGDGVNDFFVIPGISDYENNEIYIYNRWGGEVFHMKNYDNKWDGKSANSAIGSGELPQGTYFYIVKLGNSRKVIKGMVYIKR